MFKRADIGMYIAFGIAGAGLGFLVGHLIQSRLTTEPETPAIFLEDEDPRDDDTNEDWLPPEEPEDRRVVTVERRRVEGEKRVLPDRFRDLEVRPAALALFEASLITEEELYQHCLALKEEKTTYGKYTPTWTVGEEDDEEVEVWATEEVEELYEGRYLVYAADPNMNSTIVQYDPEDKDWIIMNPKGYPRSYTDVERWIPEDLWRSFKERVENGETVYVVDTKTDRSYAFRTVDTLGEDPEDLEL